LIDEGNTVRKIIRVQTVEDGQQDSIREVEDVVTNLQRQGGTGQAPLQVRQNPSYASPALGLQGG
jgi:hypothetical protein